MNVALYLARRLSLSSSRRKSAPAVKVAVAAVALSVAVMLLSIAIVLGFKREIREKVVGFNSHISLYAIPTEEGDDNLITLTPSLAATLDEAEGITDYSLEASIPAILKTDDNFKGVYLKSLNGKAIRDFIKSNLEEGRIPDYEKSASLDIVISRIAARQLGLKVGDKINTYFISDDVRVRPLKVAAIFNTHFDSYDGLFIYGDLKLIQNLGGISSNQGTSLAVHTDDFSRVEEHAGKLHNLLTEKVADGTLFRFYQVDNAMSQGAGYFHWISLLDTNVLVILVLMTFVAAVTLISGLLIIILDKKRFIGVIRAVGASLGMTRRTFLWLAMKVALWGMLIGNAVSLILLFCQDKWHFIPLDPDAYYIDFVPVEINPLHVVILNVAVFAAVWLALIIPSGFVARISPAEALQDE